MREHREELVLLPVRGLQPAEGLMLPGDVVDGLRALLKGGTVIGPRPRPHVSRGPSRLSAWLCLCRLLPV